jgi:ADP-heptose:LPS heptosyltransferase
MQFTADELGAAIDIIARFKVKQPVIIISAGTKMQSKDWGAENWVNLVGDMQRKVPNINLVLIGSAEEFAVSQACLEIWGENGQNLAGKISPRVSGALLQHACLFIGHDSGPMHLAAAVGVPVVAVFSAQNVPRQWYPRGDNNTVLYHKTDCAGCGLEVCTEQRKKCILSITVPEVMEAVMGTLKKIGVTG